MAVSKRLRFEILRRDNHACRYCGAMAPDVKLTVDHVVPVALGGSDDPSNLVTACAGCNSGKSSITPDAPMVDDISDRALAWADALKLAWFRWREERDLRAFEVDSFDEEWLVWGRGEGDTRITVPRDDNWRSSVERWLAAGFEVDELIDLIPIAMKADVRRLEDRWRYYCGVVWRTLDEVQAETARVMQEREEGDDLLESERWGSPGGYRPFGASYAPVMAEDSEWRP